MISSLTGDVRKLVDDAFQAAFSPDASQIAFRKADEIWLMGPNGETPKRFMPPLEAGYQLRGPKWSSDGTRVVYLKNNLVGGESSIEARSVKDGSTSVLLRGTGLLDFWWTSDGRLIYTRAESSEQAAYALWEQRIEKSTNAAAGQSRRLAKWIGYSPGFVSVSADGKRITTTRGYSQSDIFVAELDQSGKRIKSERRLTQDTRSDWPAAWTPDGKAIVYFSNRNGPFNIFKQGTSQQTAEALITGKDDVRAPQISSDGRWLLYLMWPAAKNKTSSIQPVRLMRVPQSGGAAETVLEAKGGFAGGVDAVAGSFPDFRCPTAPDKSCVIAEAEQNQLIFTAFDPVGGRKAEVARIQAAVSDVFWDLSPDGSRLVHGQFAWGGGDKITIVSLVDGKQLEIPINNWSNLNSVSWFADGRSLYLTTLRREGSTLLRADLNGGVDVLRDQEGRWVRNPRPSSDGSLLAFALSATDSNVWLIEVK